MNPDRGQKPPDAQAARQWRRGAQKGPLPEAEAARIAECCSRIAISTATPPPIRRISLRPGPSRGAAFRHSPFGLRVADLLDSPTHRDLSPVLKHLSTGLYRAAGGNLGPPRAPAVSPPTRAAPRDRLSRPSRCAGHGASGCRPGDEASCAVFLEAWSMPRRPKFSLLMAASPVPLKEGGKGECPYHANAHRLSRQRPDDTRRISRCRRRQPHPRLLAPAISRTRLPRDHRQTCPPPGDQRSSLSPSQPRCLRRRIRLDSPARCAKSRACRSSCSPRAPIQRSASRAGDCRRDYLPSLRPRELFSG